MKQEKLYTDSRQRCRPFTGAWIETSTWVSRPRFSCVAPSRGRGLKLVTVEHWLLYAIRRPFTGAWIETTHCG